MRRMLPLLLALCLLLCGCDLLTEKSYGRLSWEADTLLVYRFGSGEALMIEDAQAISDLRDSFTWCNFHLECCMDDPDFLVLAYQDGERVFDFYGYDSLSADSYNREVVAKLYALGQAEPNAALTRVTVPGGILPEDVAALLPAATILPVWPEVHTARARSITLRASYTMPFETSEEITQRWTEDAPLGEFAPDDVFLPLRDALAAEGVLRHAGEVWSPTRRLSPDPGDSYCQRDVVFYLTAAPAFTEWEGLEIEVQESYGWEAWLVTESALNDTERAALEANGIQITE